MSPAISPHTLTCLPWARPSAMVFGHQAQHCRVHGVVQVGNGLVSPVNGQGVLNQVIGANGQKVKVLQEHATLSVSAAAGISIMAPI
jgi:hypothetical protein